MTHLAAALRSAPGDGRTRRGLWVSFATPFALELAGSALPEWLGVDLQHGDLALSDVKPLLRSTTRPVLVRLPSHDPAVIQQVMDAGVDGVIVPAVEGADEARRLVDAAYLPPRGRRSTGLARANFTGSGEQPLLLAMVETRRGLDNAAEIAAVAGIDGLFIGPYDLSQSLGCALDDPDLMKAFHGIVTITRDLGCISGAFIGSTALEREIPAVDLLAVDSDAAALLAGLRALFPSAVEN